MWVILSQKTASRNAPEAITSQNRSNISNYTDTIILVKNVRQGNSVTGYKVGCDGTEQNNTFTVDKFWVTILRNPVQALHML
jgi:hypothetical protein